MAPSVDGSEPVSKHDDSCSDDSDVAAEMEEGRVPLKRLLDNRSKLSKQYPTQTSSASQPCCKTRRELEAAQSYLSLGSSVMNMGSVPMSW